MRRAELGLVLGLSLLLALACGRPAEEPAEHGHGHEQEDHDAIERITFSPEAYAASGIEVAAVESRVLAPTVRVTGTLSYDERKMAVATARIGGRIARVVADHGQQVGQGEPLAWIDSPELGAAQAEYRRALSLHRLRTAEHDRARLLAEGQALSRGELLRREADLRAAEADLETAEQKLHILGLSQTEVEALADEGTAGHAYAVRAPVAGRVTERKAVPGRVVAPEDELFTVARLDTLWLFLQLFEKDLPSIRSGASVTLTCESHPTDRFRGTIDFVGEVLDPHSRTVSARAVIDNPAGELKPGMFVYATIEGGAGQPPESARLAIPEQAVGEVEGSSVVFVEVGERAFEIRPVVLGATIGEWVEVREGLEQGEPIAVAGVFTLESEVGKGGLEGHEH
jgi:cobalt-zinc-cadmium efflux system membrane fusion protein